MQPIRKEKFWYPGPLYPIRTQNSIKRRSSLVRAATEQGKVTASTAKQAKRWKTAKRAASEEKGKEHRKLAKNDNDDAYSSCCCSLKSIKCPDWIFILFPRELRCSTWHWRTTESVGLLPLFKQVNNVLYYTGQDVGGRTPTPNGLIVLSRNVALLQSLSQRDGLDWTAECSQIRLRSDRLWSELRPLR